MSPKPFRRPAQSAGQYVQQFQQGIPQAQSMVVSGYNQFQTQLQSAGAQLQSALDHSQGKWFAPGEALPPGFQITSHPEGHVEPQAHHAMSDAVASLKGMPGKLGSALDDAAKAAAKGKDKKKSKKKKSSGWC
ncbi:pgk-1 [Symbiodinium natans]|uniref:Pgk-1 protein n=1 Tax=Symbiodinium natans TaxID=878477 RepID=A0A812M3H3_9DINO|nr:pgk-1 [Symbiodinium natans]